MNEEPLICLDNIPEEKRESYLRVRARDFDMSLRLSRRHFGAYKLVDQAQPTKLVHDGLTLADVAEIFNEIFGDIRRHMDRVRIHRPTVGK